MTRFDALREYRYLPRETGRPREAAPDGSSIFRLIEMTAAAAAGSGPDVCVRTCIGCACKAIYVRESILSAGLGAVMRGILEHARDVFACIP